MLTISCIGMRAEPRICQWPVMPGVRCRRWRSKPSTCSSSSTTSGRGPDEAHLSAPHVDELRQLVQRGPAQEAPDAGHARIVLELEEAVGLVEVPQRVLLRVGVGDHRAELEHLEPQAVPADAGLAEEHRAAAVEAHREGDGHEERADGEQQQGRAREVERALERPRRAGQAEAPDAQHREAVEVVELDGGADDLEHARDER